MACSFQLPSRLYTVDAKSQEIIDPAYGQAGFLLTAYKYLVIQFTRDDYIKTNVKAFRRGTLTDKLVVNRANLLQQEAFHGFNIKKTIIRIGLMNLIFH